MMTLSLLTVWISTSLGVKELSSIDGLGSTDVWGNADRSHILTGPLQIYWGMVSLVSYNECLRDVHAAVSTFSLSMPRIVQYIINRVAGRSICRQDSVLGVSRAISNKRPV